VDKEQRLGLPTTDGQTSCLPAGPGGTARAMLPYSQRVTSACWYP
jgi:hypothetical protein